MVQSVRASEEHAALIYKQKCAQCHGANGEGVADGYEEPLQGSHSVDELTKLIVETMPEENPEDCIGEEARLVAEYLHRRFYSSTGDRRAPSRLTRLTIDQYRNAVADVIGRFAPAEAPPATLEDGYREGEKPVVYALPEVPGLRAEYYQSRGMSKADELAHYRSDTQVDFDFGEGSPVSTISADQFSIIWQGGLVARDTGYYQFRITTENGARLYLNLDPHLNLRKLRDDSSAAGQRALIDGWVSSGEKRELNARIFLLGGRVYPLQLEFFKYLEKTASIRLEWMPPHGTWSILDYNHLTTVRPARVYVCETPFPADDRSLGYERGSSVSPEWQSATMNAAVEAAAEVVDRLPLLAGLTDESAEREQQVRDFVLSFARIAFRRPLTDSEGTMLGDIVSSSDANLEAGVRRAVVLVLLSPHFLYTDLTPGGERPSPYTIASRLAFRLWDSVPDQELWDAAAGGQLETAEQIESQARRMMTDPRTKAKMRSFFNHWLELEDRDLAKDKQLFPEFDEAVIADLRRSLDLFVEQIVWSRDSDYRQLLLADYLVLNDRLRPLYIPAPLETESATSGADDQRRSRRSRFASDFELVSFPSTERSGVLTHPYLLSAYAYHNNTSPIHRGVFLTRNIVGRTLNPPPNAIAFKDSDFAPDLTMREKITELTRDNACMSCHSVINPLGFTLENFDAVGRWRTTDKDKPVDTKSQYTTAAGETFQIANARDIANYAVSSESAHRSFITHVFQHVVKRSPAEFDKTLVDQLRIQFTEDDFNVQRLWARIAAVTAAHDLSTTPIAIEQ